MVQQAKRVMKLRTITTEGFSMRRISYLLMLAIGMVACSDNDKVPTPTPQPTPPDNVEKLTHTITITAPETRVHLSDDQTHAEWDKTGEYIMVYESIGTQRTSVSSDEGMVSNGKASFTATFDKSAAAEYRYDAIYPASAVKGESGGYPVVEVPEVQYPTATSFDGNADVMVALPQVRSSQPDAMELRFKHFVAFAKMTLTGLPESEKISSVSFSRSGHPLTGRFQIDLDEVTEYGLTQYQDHVTVQYATPVAVDTPIYFAINSTYFYEGDSFTVSVTTDKASYERTVTLPDERYLHIKQGELAVFSVDIPVEKPATGIEALVGNWHIAQYADDTTPDFDIYLAIDSSSNVVLYQRLASYSWSRYDSVATYADDIISGTYSDGVEWGASYRVELDASGDTMTWTNTLDAVDSTVYERVDALPDELSEVTRGGFLAFDAEAERYL